MGPGVHVVMLAVGIDVTDLLVIVLIMDSSNASNANTTNSTCGSFPSSTQTRDPAWEWGERQDPENHNIITCLLCHKEFAVKRTKKAHKATIDLAYQRASNSDEGSDADTDVEEQEVETDSNVGSGSGSASQLLVQNQTKRKRISQSNTRGPIDLFMRTNHQKTQKATAERNCAAKEKLLKTAWKCISAWMTENSIAFNTIRCLSFQQMIFAIGDYGKAMSPPYYHQIRTNLFKEQLEEIKKFVDTFREHWKRFGCSIMSYGWTDGKKRYLINFLVNYPKGSVFLKSVDASNRTLVKEVINDVGAENIVHFITDNGSNFKKEGKDLQLEYPHMFWTPCGAHYVQLMLEELGAKLPRIKTTIILGKRLVTYFMLIFKWVKTRFARETVGVNALKIDTNSKFWEDVDYSCRVLKPLVKVVSLEDIKRKPTMPYFYEAMRIARDQLEKNLSEDNDTWDTVKAVFDKIWKNNFNHPLHCAAYYLNPSIFHKIPSHLMDNDPKYIEIERGLHKAMKRLITNEDELELETTELRRYSDAYGILGTPVCKKEETKINLLHSKKRNRIKQQKFNDSVFIQYNKKLQRRYKEISEYNDDETAHDPIFLDERDENDEWLDPHNLEDLAVEGDNVTLDDLQDILGEESQPVGSKGACSSRSKNTYLTYFEYDGYDTDQLMLDTDYGVLDGADGVTEDDDIYNDSYDFE
ncbi:uncharacterized protein LOC113350646 [Papaver somniferum]|uniref:uncharacterized protein LOC113350646 n=1 Tax=Papaver somniferum TaxID=3469 RepID=UPI000E6F526E|nr:uncharacterized protein LOC113350646 [Papaver somniferum]